MSLPCQESTHVFLHVQSIEQLLYQLGCIFNFSVPSLPVPNITVFCFSLLWMLSLLQDKRLALQATFTK